MTSKYYVVKELIIPKVNTMKDGDMGFFKDLICYMHLFPNNVKLEELPDYDPLKKPKDKLVIEVSLNEKWNGYAIFYPTYIFEQCKYCHLDDVLNMLNKDCGKRINKIFENLNTDFAQMIYELFNIKITYMTTFIEQLANSGDQSS
ncbi:hypothetical protein [Acidianus bottle-shaped virus 3 strain ABV3]|uniref:Uncharacterized protein n=1 Tax=Acidianus bottle-shaped virus 3 strain ABV3 TaxID=1732174 RepID=A0A0N9PAY6_9VIRU|nr:hypothetical protein AVU00_gp06 [Acidianus bottle-shaped virus 3 strain ABV3]ALG96808.1 hypothetical protein [Acidianus bottle-shaped virus 3 strain ABV3]